MDHQGNENQQKNNIVPQSSFNDSAISNFPSTSSYQQFEASVDRNSTLVTSKLSLDLIIYKFRNHNREIDETNQEVRRTCNDRKQRFDRVIRMYEEQQERSKRNLEMYRERQALCVDEMKRLENKIRGLSERLYQVEGTNTDDEENWDCRNTEE